MFLLTGGKAKIHPIDVLELFIPLDHIKIITESENNLEIFGFLPKIYKKTYGPKSKPKLDIIQINITIQRCENNIGMNLIFETPISELSQQLINELQAKILVIIFIIL